MCSGVTPCKRASDKGVLPANSISKLFGAIVFCALWIGNFPLATTGCVDCKRVELPTGICFKIIFKNNITRWRSAWLWGRCRGIWCWGWLWPCSIFLGDEDIIDSRLDQAGITVVCGRNKYGDGLPGKLANIGRACLPSTPIKIVCPLLIQHGG